MQNGKANPGWCERDAEGAAENGLGAPYRAAKDAVRLRRRTPVTGSGYGSTRRGPHREVRAKQGGNTEAVRSRPWMIFIRGGGLFCNDYRLHSYAG